MLVVVSSQTGIDSFVILSIVNFIVEASTIFKDPGCLFSAMAHNQ